MSEFKPTPADEYPIVRDEEIELPSGAKAIIRRPSMFMLMRRGLVPPDIRDLVIKLQDGEELPPAETVAFLDFLTAASFVSPKVEFKRKKGALCIEDIPDEDRYAVIGHLKLRKAF